MNITPTELLTSFFGKKPSSDIATDYYFSQRPPHPFHAVCYAPFKSLYFGHGGKVIACCQNRNYILGTYPVQTIKEIWEGEKANMLRGALKNDRFDLGCESCHTRILSKNYKGLLAASYDYKRLNTEGYPSELQFELNNTCNLECIMCNGEYSSSIRSNREKRAPVAQVYDRTFTAQLTEFIPYLLNACFFGGEPFLIDIYYDIWEEMTRINPGINILIQSNGTVLNHRMKNLLERGKFHINISVDSVSELSYPKIRVNGNWNKTRINIEWFADYCHRRNTIFGISICPMQQNWHELVDIVKYANSLGASAFIHRLVSPSHAALRSLPKNELKIVYDNINRQLEHYTDISEIASFNRQVLNDYLSEIQYEIENYHVGDEIFNPINTLYDFYFLMEKKLKTEPLDYEPESIIDKFKKALSGLENDSKIIEKFCKLNLNHEGTWREMLNAIHMSDSVHLRYLVTHVM